MNKQVETSLIDWARRVQAATADLLPVSSNATYAQRKQAALDHSLKVFERKQASIDELSAYLDYAGTILDEELKLGGVNGS